jgi:hypothetical protein
VCRVNHFNFDGLRFTDDEEVGTEVRKLLSEQSKYFSAAGFDSNGICVSMLVGDMVRKKVVFQARISHAVRFVSTCDLLTDTISFGIYMYFGTLCLYFLTVVIMKYRIFWSVTLCCLENTAEYRLPLHGRKVSQEINRQKQAAS